MAKRPTKPPTAKYRLTDLKISKVSLVDEPAVPKAVFVIAKRKDETPKEPVAKSEPATITPGMATSGTDLQWTSGVGQNPQLTELSKKLDALTDAFQKFLDLQVSKQSDLEVVVAKTPLPGSATIHQNSKRLAKHVALLDRLSRRVNSTDTNLRNVTGELPPDEE